MVPPSSVRISRAPTYLIRCTVNFVYGTITLYRRTFQTIPLSTIHSANPLSLAATQGISVDFFSSGYLDVSVPRVRLIHLCIQCMIPVNRWVSPFRDLGITVRLPTPPSLSQAPTSFIASSCQGIHRMHLVAWPYNSNHWKNLNNSSFKQLATYNVFLYYFQSIAVRQPHENNSKPCSSSIHNNNLIHRTGIVITKQLITLLANLISNITTLSKFLKNLPAPGC